MTPSKKIAALFVSCLLAGLCACQPAVDTGRLDAAMSDARAGVISRPSSQAGASVWSEQPQTSSDSAPLSSQPEEPTTAQLAEQVQIPIAGDKLTDDPAYIPSQEEMREDDPQYNQPSREEPEEEIQDTLPPPPPSVSSTVSETVSRPASSSQLPSGESTASQPDGSSEQNPPPENGWYEKDGNTYFYVDGQPVTGWQTAGGFKYYFNDKGVLSSKRGIDVSVYQGNINWAAVKAAGVDFAMIRVGYRGYGQAGNMKLDVNFEQNLKGAQAAGIDCGVYFFSQAITRAEAVEEAKFVLEAIKGYSLTYPVAFDTEYYPLDEARTNLAGLTDKDRTDFAIDFCETIRSAGYYPTIYASKSWLLDDMEISRLGGWDIWLAHYTNQTNFQYPYQIWQYSESGTIDGISGNRVDLNVSLKDYPSVIRSAAKTNLALTAEVAASSQAEGYPAAAAADGWASGESRWMAAPEDESPWLQLDFGRETALNRVWFGSYDKGWVDGAAGAGEAAAAYALEYWDGEDWQTIVSGGGLGFSRALSFPTVYTRRLRLHVTEKTAAGSGLSVWEFAAYLDGALAEIRVGEELLPDFAPAAASYNVTLLAGVTLPVTARPENPADTLTVEQTEEKAVITLTSAAGPTVVYTVNFTYRVGVLAEIKAGDYPLPGFDPETLAYNVTLPAGVTLPVTARPENPADTVAVEQTEEQARITLTNVAGATAVYTVDFTYLDDPAVLEVYNRIEALPDTITEAEYEEVENLRAAYDGLTDEGRTAILNLPRLLAAEMQLPGRIVPGDMDGNGNVTIQDVMEACKVLARQSAGKAPTKEEMLRGNLDGDDTFTISDVMEICKILARQA
ncbi:MAG: hypothetical protein HFE86_09035 [Clostridiales bacterium]|nr:hypothetical protein [Clostridiales bacterium]